MRSVPTLFAYTSYTSFASHVKGSRNMSFHDCTTCGLAGNPVSGGHNVICPNPYTTCVLHLGRYMSEDLIDVLGGHMPLQLGLSAAMALASKPLDEPNNLFCRTQTGLIPAISVHHGSQSFYSLTPLIQIRTRGPLLPPSFFPSHCQAAVPCPSHPVPFFPALLSLRPLLLVVSQHYAK